MVFPYAPTATVLGFISSFIGGLVVMGFLAILGQTVIIPVAIPTSSLVRPQRCLAMPPAAGKARLPGASSPGSGWHRPGAGYPIMESVGLSGTSFPETDFVALGLVVYYIGKMLP